MRVEVHTAQSNTKGIGRLSGHRGALVEVLGTDGVTVYSDLAGSLQRIAGPGDELFGKTVCAAVLHDQGLSGDNLAFSAAFTDGTSGIYMVPEPAGVALLMIAATLVRWRRRPERFGRLEAIDD